MTASRASFLSPAPTTLVDTLEQRLWQARPRLLRIAWAFGIPCDIAEDIVQETALRAWRSLADVREADHFDNWINTICRNQCRMYLRGRRRAPEPLPLMLPMTDDVTDESGLPSNDLVDPLAVDPLDAVCVDDVAPLLERAFTYLSPRDRAVLELRYIRDIPHDEVAAVLGITPHVLEARLHRARIHLRRALVGPLSRDAEDFGLGASSDDSWQPTRIGCYLCGLRKLQGRFESMVDGRIELRLRCPSCLLRSHADVFRSKGIAPLVGLRSFRPALTRSLRALAERTRETMSMGRDVCLHCGSPVQRRVVFADEFPSVLSQRRHWVVAPCPTPACPGMGAWAALDAVIGAEPAAQRFIADHPRWLTAPEEAVEWQGRSVIRFQLGDTQSAARLTVLADWRALHPLAVFPD